MTGPAGPPPRSEEEVTASTRRLLQAGVLTAVLIAYTGPVTGYLDQRSQLAEEQARLAAAIEKRDQVRRQLDALGQPAVLEARARTIGMVKPGERLFFVNGLPAQPAPEPPPDDDGGILGWFSARL